MILLKEGITTPTKRWRSRGLPVPDRNKSRHKGLGSSNRSCIFHNYLQTVFLFTFSSLVLICVYVKMVSEKSPSFNNPMCFGTPLFVEVGS